MKCTERYKKDKKLVIGYSIEGQTKDNTDKPIVLSF